MLSLDTLRTVSALTGIFSSVSQIVIATAAMGAVENYAKHIESQGQFQAALAARRNEMLLPPQGADMRLAVAPPQGAVLRPAGAPPRDPAGPPQLGLAARRDA